MGCDVAALTLALELAVALVNHQGFLIFYGGQCQGVHGEEFHACRYMELREQRLGYVKLVERLKECELTHLIEGENGDGA